jgi:hypothetical protein
LPLALSPSDLTPPSSSLTVFPFPGPTVEFYGDHAPVLFCFLLGDSCCSCSDDFTPSEVGGQHHFLPPESGQPPPSRPTATLLSLVSTTLPASLLSKCIWNLDDLISMTLDGHHGVLGRWDFKHQQGGGTIRMNVSKTRSNIRLRRRQRCSRLCQLLPRWPPQG